MKTKDKRSKSKKMEKRAKEERRSDSLEYRNLLGHQRNFLPAAKVIFNFI